MLSWYPLSEWLSLLLALRLLELSCIQLPRMCVVPIDFSFRLQTSNREYRVGGEGFRRLDPPPLQGLGV